MAKETSVIETGVDKLVELIRLKKKISVQEAAKSLGVGSVVVEEWADFLEEEGLISIEYKFATPYLVEKKLSGAEIKNKEKEFHSKKEGFIRKTEVTLAVLDREGEDFQKFKDKFEKLKKDLGSDLEHVETEFKQLEKFENFKKNIDKQILEEEKEFRKKITDFEAEISREQQKYGDIIDSINSEEERLDKERLETLSLKEKELEIKKKLEQFVEIISKINETVKKDNSIIEDSHIKIKNLKKRAEKIKSEIMAKKERGRKLFEESVHHKKKILELQHEILEKVAKNKAEISKQVEEGKGATEKFREFFAKKSEMEKLILDMDKQRDCLEQELIELIKKAKAFHLSSKSSSLKGHIKELESKFENIKKKKSKFEQEAAKLSSLLKS